MSTRSCSYCRGQVAERVTEIDRFGDRIVVVKVKADPVDMVIVQAYLPTTDYEDEEIENCMIS